MFVYASLLQDGRLSLTVSSLVHRVKEVRKTPCKYFKKEVILRNGRQGILYTKHSINISLLHLLLLFVCLFAWVNICGHTTNLSYSLLFLLAPFLPIPSPDPIPILNGSHTIIQKKAFYSASLFPLLLQCYWPSSMFTGPWTLWYGCLWLTTQWSLSVLWPVVRLY